MEPINKWCIIGVCTVLALLTVLSVLYWWYRRRPQRGASPFVAAAIDGGEELRLSDILADLRASTSVAFRGHGGECPPPPWPRQGPDPLLEYFRQRPIARPTRVPPSPPQETRPRRRPKRRRRHKAHRRSAHPVTRRKSLVGTCAEAPRESGSDEGAAAEKNNRAEASARRADSGENDYAHGRGPRRPETRVFRKGSGRRSLRRGRLVPLEARPAAVGRTPKPSKQKQSTGLQQLEDHENVLPGPLGSPTPSFASQREILIPPPSAPLRPPDEGYRLCLLGSSASALPPTPAISPMEMVSLLEQQAAASFPVPWVVVSAVAPSKRGVWPPLAHCPRHMGRLHPGLCLPRGSDQLTAYGVGKAVAASPVIRRRSRSKGKEGQGRPFTPPTPDLNSRGFNV